MVEIIPMRIAKMVVHLENPVPFLQTRASGTTKAILYAIRNKCDVISMSHGGLPSRALADAVNEAYESGVAMFFASGDYLKGELPVKSPRFVVYPAAFPRTMCVCGVTADFKTYGEPPRGQSALMRGNWGPKAWMRNAIAAFTPNVPWPHLPSTKYKETREDVIDLNGQGTSASTPQAAAAAALWLQLYEQDEDLKQHWRNWRKAEAVYDALRRSARVLPDKRYSEEYFGNGILRARKALDEKPRVLTVEKQKEAKVGLGWIRLLTSTLPIIRGDDLSEDEGMDAMLDLEISQLVQRSVALQELIVRHGGFQPDGTDTPTQEFHQEFFKTLKNDPRCSDRLRNVINQALKDS